MPELPDGENPSGLSLSVTENDKLHTKNSFTVTDESNAFKSERRHGINSSWQPLDDKTASGFNLPV